MMTWVRANIWIVVLCVLIVLVLPAGWVAGSMWNGRIRQERQNAVDEARQKLASVEKISYVGKEVIPNDQALKTLAAPNERLIERYARVRAEQEAQVAGVVAKAQEINARGHAPLVEGLFPDPAESERQAKVLEFMGALVPTRDPANPSAYERLLASIGAGGPPDATVVVQSLKDARQRELDRVKAETNSAELTEDQQKEIARLLVGQRLSLYRQGAEQVSVYATMGIFPEFDGTAAPRIPGLRLAVPPGIETCFAWQSDYWAVQDVLGAIRLANTGPDGRPTTVPASVVKRIESIRLEPNPWEVQQSAPRDDGAAPVVAVDPRSALIQPVYTSSITGRIGGRANQLYDVRKAKVTGVVSLANLPQLFNAVSRSDFMTVTGVSLRPVNINVELDYGYFYGSEAVIRADIEIEIVWLRQWTVPFMPEGIRSDLGIAGAEPGGQSPEGAQPATPKGRGGR